MSAATPATPPGTAILPGDVIAGKYRVDRIIGVGGMGVVVSAMHVHLDERVAVKLLRPEGAGRSETTERFMREARAAVKIKSQHVARVMDVGVMSDGRPYMVMEYLEGRDLGEELERNGPMPEALAVDYVLQACDALAEAHKRGIVHRDLKPSNLFLCKNVKPPIIKLLDFGVSKFKGNSLLPDTVPHLTAEAALIGTPYYMSPEQIRNAKDVDERADVWALGVILYELISGRVPFDGTSATGVLAAICGDKPKPLHEVCATVSADVSEIVGACLAKNLEERMPNVRELVRALASVAPDKASTIDERLAGINIPSTTANSIENPLTPPISDVREPISIRSSGPMSKDEMLGATVGGVIQTNEPVRSRSRLFAVLAAIAVISGIVVFVLTNQSPTPPTGDHHTTANSGESTTNSSTPSAVISGPSQEPPSPSARVEIAEPLPVTSSSTSSVPTKSTATAKTSNSSSTRTTSGGIQLGKEVETRR